MTGTGRMLFFLMLLLQFPGCRGKDDIPSDVLPPQKMRKVMWEIFQADYYAEQFVRRDSSRNAVLESAGMQEQIFRRHGVSRKEYEESYRFYTGHPDLMKALMDSITASGEHQRNLLMQKTLCTARFPGKLMHHSGSPAEGILLQACKVNHPVYHCSRHIFHAAGLAVEGG